MASKSITYDADAMQPPPTLADWERVIETLPIAQVARRFRQMEGQFYSRPEYDTLVREVGGIYQAKRGVRAALEFHTRLDGLLEDAGYEGVEWNLGWTAPPLVGEGCAECDGPEAG
jgi:hypothetical protein